MGDIRVVVADDEPLARRGVRQLLAPYRDMEVVAECRNGRETVDAIRLLKTNLLFLDVQMPEMGGIEALADLKPQDLVVVFVTAHENYAIRAFDLHALDYLVKPIHVDRFRAMLDRVREHLSLTRDAMRA